MQKKMVQVSNVENFEQDPYKYTDDSTSLLSKYDIPITHLDFPYVEKCTNGKELEKILHVLKSGQEGYYPELMKAVEEKLRILLPKSRFLRNLSRVLEPQDLEMEEWEVIHEDLKEWVVNISKENKELELRKGGQNTYDYAPEIRQSKILLEEKQCKTESRIKSTDYSTWDKYDPDTEILKMDLEEEKLKKEATQNHAKKKPKKRVKFNSFPTETEANYEANREREKGNECFKAGEYNSALIHYTSSLQYKTTVQCLNNRAVTYLKKEQYQNAVADCDSALAIEPRNLKANFRKAQALERLQLFEEGLGCIEECIRIDPNNIDVQELACRIRRKSGIRLERKRFAIEDVCEREDKEGVLGNNKQNEQKEKQKINITEKERQVVIPIPGTSKMQEPYYVVCESEDAPNITYTIYNRPEIIGLIITPPQEEEECLVDHLEHISSKKHSQISSDVITSETTFCTNEVCNEHEDRLSIKEENSVRTKKRMHKTILNRLQDINLQDDNAGGEPYKTEHVLNLTDILSPYTFLKTWTSAGNDPTFKKHAEIIRKLNMNQLVRVIGCKLDNDMFSTILKTLCMHFTVAGELEKIRSVLVNIPRLPRFGIISMLMSEQDRNQLNYLISFLYQHGKSLPEEVRKSLM
ncbi:hypothetical protein HHI36_004219 [Cryptolaemus montrouzieri]|uniref:RNA-polymerase II-associated protein 3-like C-terminal domain-containing protein n=1 Tax=Cryptolaemus montrouzieri TaxID=559131 RepID=A0ABD2NQU9_9CUCU